MVERFSNSPENLLFTSLCVYDWWSVERLCCCANFKSLHQLMSELNFERDNNLVMRYYGHAAMTVLCRSQVGIGSFFVVEAILDERTRQLLCFMGQASF